jgi:hypothetical protein
LFDVGARVFVFHDENLALTFHPKVYLAHTSEGGAWLSIGSSNLTAGGLYSNYEINAIRLLDLKNDGDRTILQDIDRLFREFSDTSNECCKELNDGIVGDLLAQGYVQDESEARNNLIKAAREKSKRKKMFGTRKLTEPPQELIKAKDAVAKAIGDVKELNEGFWKKLSNWDVSLRSSPGQIQIPIRFIDYLPTLSDPLAMESGAIQSDAFLNVRYSDPEGGEQIVKNARIILYEPAPKHKRPNMELRFTFRTREILESLRANDVLEFRKTSDPDFFMSIRRIPSKRTKAYKGRFGSISDDK